MAIFRRSDAHIDPVSALAAGDVDRALELYRRMVAQDPSRATTWRKKVGDVLVQAGRPREAAMEYLAVARALQREGRMGQVLALYRTVLRIDPNNADVRARLAEIAVEPEERRPTGPGEAPAGTLTMRTRLRTFVPLFSQFEKDELTRVLEVMSPRSYRAGQTVFNQGDAGDSLFILAQGEIVLTVGGSGDQPVEIDRLKDGGFFGEVSALTRAPRNLTARCLTTCDVLELARDYLEAVAIAHPRIWDVLEEFQKTRAVPAGV